jgi:hypothetical protein
MPDGSGADETGAFPGQSSGELGLQPYDWPTQESTPLSWAMPDVSGADETGGFPGLEFLSVPLSESLMSESLNDDPEANPANQEYFAAQHLTTTNPRTVTDELVSLLV